jgi:hypothetical protein
MMSSYTPNHDLKKPDQDEFYNVDDFNENADKIDAAIPTRQILTLPADAWDGNTAIIEVPGITADMPPASYEVGLAGTVAQYTAAAAAGLGNTDLIAGDGTITITAIGIIPAIDIDIVVTIYGGAS